MAPFSARLLLADARNIIGGYYHGTTEPRVGADIFQLAAVFWIRMQRDFDKALLAWFKVVKILGPACPLFSYQCFAVRIETVSHDKSLLSGHRRAGQGLSPSVVRCSL